MQMWEGRAQSRRRKGRNGPSPGADVGRGEPGPGADVVGAEPSPGADVARASPVPAQMWRVTREDQEVYCAPLRILDAPARALADGLLAGRRQPARGATVQHELRRAARHTARSALTHARVRGRLRQCALCPPALLLGPSHSQARATRTTCTVRPSAAQTGLRAHDVTRASGCDCACSVRTKRGARAPVREERRKFPEASGPHARTHARMHARTHARTHRHMHALVYIRTQARTHARTHAGERMRLTRRARGCKLRRSQTTTDPDQ